MTRKLFGTDGIRGTANAEPMTAETALKVAMAAGACFRRGDHRHLVVIGKDTRLSGYMLEPALTAGFIAMGMDVVMSGPLPTPAIAMLTQAKGIHDLVAGILKCVTDLGKVTWRGMDNCLAGFGNRDRCCFS